MSRAEITPCASHVKRTASTQLAQKSTMAVSDQCAAKSEKPGRPGKPGIQSQHDRTRMAQII
jgi:hypothetical protein